MDHEPRAIIGIDPGGTTGFAVLRIVGDALIDTPLPFLVHAPADASVETLQRLLRLAERSGQTRICVAIERFLVGQRAARNRGSTTPQKLVGQLTRAVPMDVTVREYSAGTVKPWATDQRLRAAGCYIKGKGHARDAARIALYHACRDHGVTDPLAATL